VIAKLIKQVTDKIWKGKWFYIGLVKLWLIAVTTE